MACNNILLIILLSVWTFNQLLATAIPTTDLDFYVQNQLNHGGDLYVERETKTHQEQIESDPPRRNKDITAIPEIFNGTLYFPKNGFLYAVNPIGGTIVWEKNLQNLTGLSPTGLVRNYENCTVSVATPTTACDLLIVGIYGPAVVIAVERATGELVWSTQLDSHVASVVAMPGVLHQGAFYVGTSSVEEWVGGEQCCTFRGGFFKLNASTGAILWRTHTLPAAGGYSGAALWRSSPAIDESRRHVYVVTGSLYSAPPHVREQEQPEDRSNSALALDLCTGEVAWSQQLWDGGDGSEEEEEEEEEDYRVRAPMMLSVLRVNETTERDVVIAQHKSGHRWALDRDNGDLLGFTEPLLSDLTGVGGVVYGPY